MHLEKFSRPGRGTILVTAMFVILVVHALVTVMLTTLRADTGQLQTSERRLQASLRAHSAALYALDQLHGPQGITWESQHTVSGRVDKLQPPSEAADVTATLSDGSSLQAKAWVEEESNPNLRTVWGASYDQKRWHFSTAVAVRREVNPGLLFGVTLGPLVDDFYFRPANGDGTWQKAPGHPSLGNRVYDCSASRDGKLFILQENRTTPGLGRDLEVGVLDTTQGSNGSWAALPDLPNFFTADPTGLAAGEDELYVAGKAHATNQAAILKLPLASPAAGWSSLTTLPQSVVLDQNNQTTITSMPFQFTDLKAGTDGELYVQLQFQSSTSTTTAETTFARYQDGSWSYFPKPSTLSGVTRRGLLPIELDDLGNVMTFGLPSDSEPGQVFRFAPTGAIQNQVVQGTWKSLPMQSLDPQLGEVSVDSEGHLFLGTRDTQSVARGIQDLTEHPLRASQQTTPNLVTMPENSFNFVEAGGEGPTGAIEYVPISWY